MPAYIAILRGINVGGARSLPMKELKVLFEKLKCANVRTYIQSGNVVFQSTERDPRTLVKNVQTAIEKQYQFEVPVLLRSLEEMERVVAKNPFLKQKGIDVEKLHVTFLDRAAAQEDLDKITGGNYGADVFIAAGQEVYLHCPEGYGNTKLNNTFFEKKLKATATTRNWRTVNELLRMGKEV